MKPRLRMFACGFILLLCLATPAAAQYMRLTTDNPADNTRLRTGVTNIVTITLDTNHDRDGTLQTCNSHTLSCGAPATSQPLNMFSYTLAYRVVGGTVSWGTFTAADAAYIDLIPQAQNDTEVEINQARPVGTVTDPGLSTIGTIPVTVVSGSPSIRLQIGPGALNPFGFGTGFGTFCDGFDSPNTYVAGDPSHPCGIVGVRAGDWFDFDGVSTTSNEPPPPGDEQISAPATANGTEGVPLDPITATASDPDGSRTLTITQSQMPADLTFTTTPGPSPVTATISGTPGFSDSGIHIILWTVNDGVEPGGASTSTRLTIANNEPVFIEPILDANVTCGPVTRTAYAHDNNSDPITFSFTGPPFMTLTPNPQINTDRSATITLAPGPSEAGTFTATVTATSVASTFSRSFNITVIRGCPPTLNSIADMNVSDGSTLDQTITAQDANGDPLTFVKVTGSPPFMTVTTTGPGTGSATGNVHLAPGAADVGFYSAGVYVTDGSLTDNRNFSITVCNGCSGKPVLNAILDMWLPPGTTQDQAVSGSDPDGDALTFSKTTGPSFMTVTTTSPITGNIHLAPPPGTQGNFSARVAAGDGTLSALQSFIIHLCAACEQPVFAPVSDMTVTAGMTGDQAISATISNTGPLDFRKGVGPSFMTVTTTSPGAGTATGNIHLAPGIADVGTFIASVRVHNGPFFMQQTFTITVLSANRCPFANPDGPYSGLTGVPIGFDGSASSDPDGSPLTYAWDFDASDGRTVDATGPTPSHAYATAGTFTVTLTVTDNGGGIPSQACSASATTTATLSTACGATVFNGYDTIKLNSGKPFWFAYVQPTNTCYDNSDIVVPSFVMKYAGRQISASGKTAIGVDRSGDGIQEIKISFSKNDLVTLFTGTGLGNGHNTVTVTLEANLATGGRLSGTTQLDVVNNGGFNVAVSPNPLNPQATLSWATSKAGFARIDMFDVQGRLVRRIVDEPAMAAGWHEATVDGRDQRGVGLPSGVYFIRGTLSEGEFKQIITILK